MSKLSFRARAVDASKQMPVFLADELPDLSEYASINRSVPQMPTGMEKDEEMELHLQQAISAQQRSSTGVAAENAIIPIPKVTSDVKYYERIYPPDYKLPKQLIKVQAALNLEPEIPDYDLDSEDERWLSSNGQKMDVSPLQFERIMDTLEKQSEFKVISPPEAKLLLQEDDDVLLAVYDYWLTKRYMAASQGKNLIPRVKTEKRDGTGAKHNPYVAFRRRAEKMQTRKNRRNDEESYERILKLRHDLQKAVTLAEMVKRREKSKREMINLTLDIVEKRFRLEDFRDELFSRICNEAKPSFRFSKQEMDPLSVNNKKAPLSSKKRKIASAQTIIEDKGLVSREWLLQNAEQWNRPPVSFLLSPKASAVTQEDTATCQLDNVAKEPAGRYAFKRRRGCRYYAPSSLSPKEADSAPLWPWELPHNKSCYFPTYLHSKYGETTSNAGVKGVNGLRFVGLTRRRVGRGGRMVFDREPWSFSVDDQQERQFNDFPGTSAETAVHRHLLGSNNKKSLYFRPTSPILSNELDDVEYDFSSSIGSLNPNAGTSPQDVPYAMIVGPHGVLRLSLTVGTLVQSDDQYQSPMLSSISGLQSQTIAMDNSLSSVVQRQFSNDSNRIKTASKSLKQALNVSPLRASGVRKRSSNGSGDAPVFAHPATPELSSTGNSAYVRVRSEISDGNTSVSKSAFVSGNRDSVQWRKQQDFGATTALLMRPPVRLPINENQSFDANSKRQRDPRPGGYRSAAQLQGIAATPTIPTSSNGNNYSIVSTFKGGQDFVGNVNNGKTGYNITTESAALKLASSPASSSAHTYAMSPAVHSGRQSSSHLVQTISRTPSSGGLSTMEAQYEMGQGGGDYTIPNGPSVERSLRRSYGSTRIQQITTSGGSPSTNVSTKLIGSSTAGVLAQPSNLPLDHGSYHASSFGPPSVVAISTPSVSSTGTPVAVVAPMVNNMANGFLSQEHSNSNPESAQYNGQRNFRDQVLRTETTPASSNTVVEFSHPLPTPSPSPNARFMNLTETGGIVVSSKFDDAQLKGATHTAVIGRLTPTRLVGKNRKSSDE